GQFAPGSRYRPCDFYLRSRRFEVKAGGGRESVRGRFEPLGSGLEHSFRISRAVEAAAVLRTSFKRLVVQPVVFVILDDETRHVSRPEVDRASEADELRS